jgi:hypothetical protein
MINLPRYLEKGILLSYPLNRDVSEIIIHHLKVADLASEVTFRERNQEIFRREYDWGIPMSQYADKRIGRILDRLLGRVHVDYYDVYDVYQLYPDWAVSRRVRDAVTDTCRTLERDGKRPTKTKNKTNNPICTVIYDPITKRNNRKEIARSNRVMGKHMRNR